MRNLIRALIAALSLVALPVVSQAGLFVGVSVNIAPPVLPVYVQPPCPAPGYLWTPGYWAWDDGLLLGARHLGARTGCGPAVDARLLGLG